MDTYTKAKSELAEIDSQIAALQQRRESLRRFVDLGASLYGSPNDAGLSSITPLGYIQAGLADIRAIYAHERTAKARILAICEAHISQRGATPTRDLLVIIEAAGVEISGADKINTLSVLLSKSNKFVSDRKVGWSLNRPHEEKPPQGVDAPAGADVGHP